MVHDSLGCDSSYRTRAGGVGSSGEVSVSSLLCALLLQERDTGSVSVNLPVPSGVAFPPVFHRSQERQVEGVNLDGA